MLWSVTNKHSSRGDRLRHAAPTDFDLHSDQVHSVITDQHGRRSSRMGSDSSTCHRYRYPGIAKARHQPRDDPLRFHAKPQIPGPVFLHRRPGPLVLPAGSHVHGQLHHHRAGQVCRGGREPPVRCRPAYTEEPSGGDNAVLHPGKLRKPSQEPLTDHQGCEITMRGHFG